MQNKKVKAEIANQILKYEITIYWNLKCHNLKVWIKMMDGGNGGYKIGYCGFDATSCVNMVE